MAKYVIDGDTLKGLADAIRSVTGETRSYNPTEMIEAVTNILDGTYILVDENGTEIPAVFVESETRFDATANDIRIGKVAVTDSGVTVGTKEIPSYHTMEGVALITAGSDIKILGVRYYDFTKLQALICAFNTTLEDSVATEKVSIDNKVYAVGSTEPLATVTANDSDETIDFGIKNEASQLCLVRYFAYKEVT